MVDQGSVKIQFNQLLDVCTLGLRVPGVANHSDVSHIHGYEELTFWMAIQTVPSSGVIPAPIEQLLPTHCSHNRPASGGQRGSSVMAPRDLGC